MPLFRMMGLYLQAFTDVLVQDWEGYVNLFHCLLPEWIDKQIAFAGIKTTGGATVSGKWENGKFQIAITPGQSNRIQLKIGRDVAKINATGQKTGPRTFKGGELVEFEFNGKETLTLKNF